MTPHKWAPSRCRDCIVAVAKMTTSDRTESSKAFDAYSPFLKGLRSFVERVC